MEIIIYILLGVAALVLIIWGISEIQIKVWLYRIEKHLNKKLNKFKNEENEREEEQFP